MRINAIKLPIAASLLMLIALPSAQSAEQAKRTLLALSKEGHTLAVVDPVSLKVLAKVPVGPDPHEVVASTDGKTAFVSNTGSGKYHEINVIDLESQKALPNLDTAALLGPHGLDFANGKVYFTAEGAKSVGRYDPSTKNIDWIMGTGQDRTHMVRVSADEKTFYTTNVASGTVSIFENSLLQPTMPPTGVLPPGARPHMEWKQTVIPGGKGNEGFDISPDGGKLWTAAAGDGTIIVIDLATKKVTDTIDAKVFGANRLKFTPDGKQVLVSSLKSGDLTVFDTTSKTEVKRISLGKGAAGILIDEQNNRAFVGCTADDYVAVVDLKTLTVSDHIDVGGKPDGLAWAVRQ